MDTISFKRSGGFIGKGMRFELNLNDLPIGAVRTIAVEAGNTQHTVHTSDATAPESLRPLLEKLSSLANENNSGVTGKSAE